jgi:ADP-ribose pyrophosphatase
VKEQQMRVNGPWVIQECSDSYKSEFVELVEERVTRPDGSPGLYTTVTLKDGVAVLPLDRDGNVHLTRQFRYALGRESIEVPSGTLEAGEDPLDAAKREVREELGICADRWNDLGAFDLDTSIVRCSVRLFRAEGIRFTAAEQDGTETIKPLKIPFESAVQMVMDGTITHAPSCVLLLKAAQVISDR